MSIINIAIIGVTGFTGIETLRVLLTHPLAKVINIVGNSHAGKNIAELYPALSHYNLPQIQKLEDIDLDLIDCIFTCLPHGMSQVVIMDIINKKPTLKVIDLSADFRLPVQIYEKVYSKHLAPELQDKSCYGLSELFSKEIAKAQIISCPGCFPTSSLLPLIPLKQCIDGNIIIDSKTGLTGAGRSSNYEFSFTNTSESIKAYNPHQHRHKFEIAHYLGKNVRFTPHIVPVIRGIETSIYFNSSHNCLKILQEFYKDTQFVKICNTIPSTKEVLATNICAIYIEQDGNEVFISSVIDNIAKGSSMQAIQNMNIAFGFPEETGLIFTPIIP